MQWNKPPEFQLDLKKTYTATLTTDQGDIVIRLFADKVPNTVNNFVFLARQGYYDNTIFHRVIANFMAQGEIPPVPAAVDRVINSKMNSTRT